MPTLNARVIVRNLALLRRDRAVDLARPDAPELPSISPLLLRGFTLYARRYIRRNFHSVQVSRKGWQPEHEGKPLVIYCNHASWWDPLSCLLLKSEFFPRSRAFAPIDAAMLERYKFFAKLGFFGIEQGSRHGGNGARGALKFLRTGEAILRSPGNILFITPQGRFADVRERPIRFAAGLGKLAARVKGALFVPLAIEYLFWSEPRPEMLVRFGEPFCPDRQGSANECTALLEGKLAETQDALAAEALCRSGDGFNQLLRGRTGQSAVYDVWRWLKAAWRRETFKREHGPV